MADELFEVKNSFYLGHYQQCINTAQQFHGSGDAKTEALTYMYRSYIALKKYNMVAGEINDSSPAVLRAVRVYAQFMQKLSPTSPALGEMERMLADPIIGSSPTVQLLGAMMRYHIGEYETAMQLVANTFTLECQALLIQCLLKIDRPDVAQKELKRLQEIDDDASLTQLATAWVDLAVGGEKYQDAFYIYHELSAKYGPSVMLMNGQAACLMSQGKFEEAETLLQEALSKDSDDPQTLANLIVASGYLNKPAEVTKRYLSQLRDSAPDHAFVKYYQAKEDMFARASEQYAAA